jgi:hypothetical protein
MLRVNPDILSVMRPESTRRQSPPQPAAQREYSNLDAENGQSSSSSIGAMASSAISALYNVTVPLLLLVVVALLATSVALNSRVLKEHQTVTLITPSPSQPASSPTVNLSSVNLKLDSVISALAAAPSSSSNGVGASACNCTGSANQKLCVANCVLDALINAPTAAESPEQCQQRLHDFYRDEVVLNNWCRNLYVLCVQMGIEMAPDAELQNELSVESLHATHNASRDKWLAIRKPGCMDKYDVRSMDRQVGEDTTHNSVFFNTAECGLLRDDGLASFDLSALMFANYFTLPSINSASLAMDGEDYYRMQHNAIKVYDALSFQHYVAALRSIGTWARKRVETQYWEKMNAWRVANDMPFTSTQAANAINPSFYAAFYYLDPATIAAGTNPLINDIQYARAYTMSTNERTQLSAAIVATYYDLLDYNVYTASTVLVRTSATRNSTEMTRRCNEEHSSNAWPFDLTVVRNELQSWGDTVLAQIPALANILYDDYQGINKTTSIHRDAAAQLAGTYTSFRIPVTPSKEVYHALTSALANDAARRTFDFLPRLTTVPIFTPAYMRWNYAQKDVDNGAAYRYMERDTIHFPLATYTVNRPQSMDSWFATTAHEIVHAGLQFSAQQTCPSCYFYRYGPLIGSRSNTQLEGLAVFTEAFAMPELGVYTANEAFAELLDIAGSRFTNAVALLGVRYGGWTVDECAAYYQNHNTKPFATWVRTIEHCTYWKSSSDIMSGVLQHSVGGWYYMNKWTRATSECSSMSRAELLRSFYDTALARSPGGGNIEIAERDAMFDDWIDGGCVPRYCLHGRCNVIYNV